MQTIKYRIVFDTLTGRDEDVVTVRARTVNSGFAKALKLALAPLGNGKTRSLTSIEFEMAV